VKKKTTLFKGEKAEQKVLNKGAKFKLILSKDELTMMDNIGGSNRAIRNGMLQYKITMYNQHKKNVNRSQLNDELTKLKKDPDFAWTRDAPANVYQQSIIDIMTSYKNFYEGNASFPKYRKKNNPNGMNFRLPREKAGFKFNRLSKRVVEISGLSKFRKLRFRVGNRFKYIGNIIENCEVKSASFSKVGDDWFISLSYTYLKKEVEKEVDIENGIGIDRGITVSYKFSNNKSSQLPLKEILVLENKIARFQDHAARMKKGSNNKKNKFKQIGKLHRKIANIRKDFLHKLTTELVNSHNFFVLEDLKITNMSKSASGTIENPGTMVAQKRGLNKSILRQGWGIFSILLKYKVEEIDGKLIFVNPKNTSRKCSSCGHIDKNSRTSQADFLCTKCGFECNADLNAAINIYELGLKKVADGIADTQNARVKTKRSKTTMPRINVKQSLQVA
jgi:putative transposase